MLTQCENSINKNYMLICSLHILCANKNQKSIISVQQKNNICMYNNKLSATNFSFITIFLTTRKESKTTKVIIQYPFIWQILSLIFI